MNPKIHLLYFPTCPHWKKEQGNLRTASKTLGKELEWEEINLESPDCPEKWRGFPSPTILINGTDIHSGKTIMEGSTSCRLGGASNPHLLITKIKSAGNNK